MLVSLFFARYKYFSRSVKIKNKFGLFKYFIDLMLVKGKKWKELINLVIEKEAENTVFRSRMRTRAGREILKRRRKKGRKIFICLG